MIISSLIIILLAIIITAIVLFQKSRSKELGKIVEEYDTIFEDGVKVNTSEQFAKPKQLGNLNITNIKLSCRNGLSTLLADVVNTGSTNIDTLNLRVEILDKNQDVIMELDNQIFSLEAGKSKQLNINVSADISDAYDFKITKL